MEPSKALALDMVDGRLEGIVLQGSPVALPLRDAHGLDEGQGRSWYGARGGSFDLVNYFSIRVWLTSEIGCAPDDLSIIARTADGVARSAPV